MHTYDSLLKIVNEALEKESFVKEPRNLYEPIDYTLALGGKRLRPVLTLMACDLFGKNPEEALSTAIGIEIFHNFTLVHDDIMDNAPIRRGKPSVYKKWNPNIAILSGDTMFALAYEKIAVVDKNKLPEILSLFSKTAKEVCEGQQFDIDFEDRNNVSIDEYIEMIRLKTAVLLATSLKIGALVSGTSADNAEKIYECGINMGLAFQLMDDLLDTFSNPEKFGKKTGGDIIEGKKTYLYLKALEIANPKTKEELNRKHLLSYDDQEQKIKEVIKIFEHLKIKEITRGAVTNYSDKAVACLHQIDADEAKKRNLISLIEKMTKRDY